MKRGRENHGVQGMTLGAMDAVINVLGIVVGLGAIGNRLALVVGLLAAGVANSLGNAAGFHVSEEAEGIHSRREVWLSTLMSFAGTFSVTMMLLLPFLLTGLGQAIIASVSIGILVMAALALLVGRHTNLGRRNTLKLMGEYVAMGMVVIIIAHYLGTVASGLLGDVG